MCPVDFDCKGLRVESGRVDDSCELRVLRRRGLFLCLRRALSIWGLLADLMIWVEALD